MSSNLQDDEPKPARSSEIEKHVREIMGRPPQDPDKETEDEPPEKVLVIPSSGLGNQNLASGPRAGVVINPSQEPKEYKNNQIARDVEPDEKSQVPPPISNQIFATKKPKNGRLKRFFKRWWYNRKARNLTFVALFILVASLVLFPTTRYFMLNNLGVRSSASVTVLDQDTNLPLRNVNVAIGQVSGQTDENGSVKLEHLKLGHANLVVEKRAFATLTNGVTIGWGSNPLGNFQIKGVGIVFNFVVSDWLSHKPIEKAEATFSSASAFSDALGKIRLTVDPSDVQDSIGVVVKADGYRDETVTTSSGSNSDIPVGMVITKKDAFISNRSGKYDLYTIDIDGKNEKLILSGTGIERDDIVLVPHPTENIAALVSTRVNARNTDGFLLSTLSLVNLDNGETTAVAQSEQIKLVGWVGSRLIYMQIAAGSSAADPNRFRLISYDYRTTSKTELAKGNSFNDVALIGGSVYYSVSSALQSNSVIGLIKSSADGSQKETLLKNEVWNIFRVSYDTLDLSVGKDWYEYKLGTSNPVKLHEAPANPKNRLYANNPANTHSLWIDQRDGKGVILDYDQTNATEKTLLDQSGVNYPVKWLSDSVFVYRLHDDHQSADYVMSLDGGVPRKIADVYNASGLDRWYYY